MSRQELVRRYLDGQLSRRVFIRGLIATGVTTAAALSYASVLEAVPAAAATGDFYLFITDFMFSVDPAQLAFGQRVGFHNWSYGFKHTATDASGMGLFDTGPLPKYGQAVVAIPSAGTYSYKCKEPASTHTPMSAKVRAPLVITPKTGTKNTTFTVKWAAQALPATYVVDVQRKAPGSSTWTNWKTGVTTRSATFKTATKGTWAFRARLRRPSKNKASGWSQPAQITIK